MVMQTRYRHYRQHGHLPSALQISPDFAKAFKNAVKTGQIMAIPNADLTQFDLLGIPCRIDRALQGIAVATRYEPF